jgi:hypothetical protein
MTKRRCTGTTKKGTPCKAAPLADGDTCLAHADEVTRESAGFGGQQEGAGRPRVPGPTEVARRLVEENIGAILTPHFKVLGYDVIDTPDGLMLQPIPDGGAKLHSTFMGEVVVSKHDDLGAMMSAAEKLLDRTVGKPRQVVEHSGPKGGPIQTEHQVDIAIPTVREHLNAALEASAEAERERG